MAVVTFLLLSVLAQLAAQASAPSVAAQSVTAPPVTLTIRLTDGRRQFRPGEVIPVELEFNSATAKRSVSDAVCRAPCRRIREANRNARSLTARGTSVPWKFSGAIRLAQLVVASHRGRAAGTTRHAGTSR